MSHSASVRVRKIPASSAASVILIVVVLEVREVGAIEELAQPPEELRLERADREVSTVLRRVDPVAREPAGEHAWDGLASDPVRNEVVGAVRHGDHEPRTDSRAGSLQQCCEHLRHRTERSGGEVRHLEGRERRSGVLEDACPAEVVHVVPRTRTVPCVLTETRDRAVDGGLGDVVRADAESCCDAGPKALEHDVGARAECTGEDRVVGKIADDRLAACAKRGVPGGRGRAHGVAVGGLDPDDPSAQSCQLPTGVGAREIAREVDDQQSRERLHAGGAYLYPRPR